MRELSIYIHIPFCVRKCLYCDFLSFPVQEGQRTERISSYGNLLKREIEEAADRYGDYQVVSVFWGGGTPSLLPAETVAGIMETLYGSYRVAADAEITIEANPGTVTADGLRGYITAGINRISIGLQSTDDEELTRIGRIHDYRTFLETYELARAAGFRNINIDLMAALPGQSVSSYRKTLERTAALKPEHISAYSLILEEGTPLYERQDDYRFPTEEEDREMYLLTDAFLSACGYHRYEISNYALDGYECRHNKMYWQRGHYAGFGLGAASMVENVRWSNPATFGEYEVYTAGLGHGDGDTDGDGDADEDGRQQEHTQKAGSYPARQVLTREEQMEEFMFLGLRMMCGVSPAEFEKLFGRRIEDVYGDVLCRLYRQELLVRVSDRIRLTARGIDVSNRVMAEFLLD